MSESDKFLKMFGGIFFSVGVLLGIIAVTLLGVFTQLFGGLICLLLCVCFGGTGGGILLAQIKKSNARKNVAENGTRYSGKIYGYVEDKSCTMNNDYLINIKVRYFDKSGVEREAIVPTGFTRGSGDYPIGATIDIIVLNNKCTWVENSVRYEQIDREDELMDDKPLDPKMINMVAISCAGCGASFTAARGYVSKCPYCLRAVNC